MDSSRAVPASWTRAERHRATARRSGQREGQRERWGEVGVEQGREEGRKAYGSGIKGSANSKRILEGSERKWKGAPNRGRE